MDRGVVEVGNFEDSMDDTDVELVYKSLKRFVKKHDVFRSFFVRECRKRRVFLENTYETLNSLQVKQISNKLLEEDKDDILAVI